MHAITGCSSKRLRKVSKRASIKDRKRRLWFFTWVTEQRNPRSKSTFPLTFVNVWKLPEIHDSGGLCMVKLFKTGQNPWFFYHSQLFNCWLITLELRYLNRPNLVYNSNFFLSTHLQPMVPYQSVRYHWLKVPYQSANVFSQRISIAALGLTNKRNPKHRWIINNIVYNLYFF